MTEPKTILLAAVPELIGMSRATVMRWATRGYFGPLEVPPGGERFRRVEVRAVELLLGRSYGNDQINDAVAQHAQKMEVARLARQQRQSTPRARLNAASEATSEATAQTPEEAEAAFNAACAEFQLTEREALVALRVCKLAQARRDAAREARDRANRAWGEALAARRRQSEAKP